MRRGPCVEFAARGVVRQPLVTEHPESFSQAGKQGDLSIGHGARLDSSHYGVDKVRLPRPQKGFTRESPHEGRPIRLARLKFTVVLVDVGPQCWPVMRSGGTTAGSPPRYGCLRGLRLQSESLKFHSSLLLRVASRCHGTAERLPLFRQPRFGCAGHDSSIRIYSYYA